MKLNISGVDLDIKSIELSLVAEKPETLNNQVEDLRRLVEGSGGDFDWISQAEAHLDGSYSRQICFSGRK